MRLKEYTLSFGQTVNTGNYNSTRFEVRGTVELDQDSTIDQVAEDIGELKHFLRSEAEQIRSKIKGSND